MTEKPAEKGTLAWQRAECAKGLDPGVVLKRKSNECNHNNNTTCNCCVSYLPQYYVEERLNYVFGPDGWSFHVADQKVKGGVTSREVWDYKSRAKVMQDVAAAGCITTVRLRLKWADGSVSTKDGVGGADKINKGCNIEKAFVEAAKHAEADGLKRAAKKLGATFGSSLRDKQNPVHKGRADSHGSDAGAGEPAAAAPHLIRRGADRLIELGVAGEEIDRILRRYTQDGVPESVPDDQADDCLAEFRELAHAMKEQAA